MRYYTGTLLVPSHHESIYALVHLPFLVRIEPEMNHTDSPTYTTLPYQPRVWGRKTNTRIGTEDSQSPPSLTQKPLTFSTRSSFPYIPKAREKKRKKETAQKCRTVYFSPPEMPLDLL